MNPVTKPSSVLFRVGQGVPATFALPRPAPVTKPVRNGIEKPQKPVKEQDKPVKKTDTIRVY
jgi:hypothetical protein